MSIVVSGPCQGMHLILAACPPYEPYQRVCAFTHTYLHAWHVFVSPVATNQYLASRKQQHPAGFSVVSTSSITSYSKAIQEFLIMSSFSSSSVAWQTAKESVGQLLTYVFKSHDSSCIRHCPLTAPFYSTTMQSAL